MENSLAFQSKIEGGYTKKVGTEEHRFAASKEA